MSDPKDYTVGWISALSTEYVAAQAFLDENHEPPESVSSNDNNNYTLGRIGKHNVVIAVLPDGEYGLSTAAGVARDMVHSFPNIRIGLMVGIAGGAPSKKHDIRLGDIVVGAPRDRESGVFEFDFGRTIQDQKFEYTRFLDQPPTVLRAAVSGVNAQYAINGHGIEEAINTILQKYPRLQREYKRPNIDRLYQAGVTHPSEGEAKLASCAEVCVDESSLIPRPKRTEYEDNPAIHYGLIASSNQLMKDAIVRDRLVEKKDVLCFEMEAAGLVSHFPCLIVRGICDYSDTHKDYEWQGYAAMAAAAYAKDLLSQIHPNKVEAEKRLTETLFSVHKIVSTMSSKLDKEEDLNILKWLTPIDYATQQSDYISRRQPGTGQWLLDSAQYQEWLATPGKTLFCPGIPGAGKTILTAIVIDDIYSRFQCDTSVGIAYLYCDFRRQHEQRIEDLLANLLKQLAQQQASMPDGVQTLYDQYRNQPKRPSLNEILSILHSVSVLYSNVFIIIDALDECQVTDGCRTELLGEIFGLQARARARIFATSRFDPEIEKDFEQSISLEIRASDEDVQTYLAGKIARLLSFFSSNPDLQDKIKTTISKTVDGMFLLAQLHIESLAKEPTVGDIEVALQNLPTGLDETYKQAMTRIESQGTCRRRLAKKILTWAVYAKRILSISELQHAVAVQFGKPDLDGNFIPSVGVIGSICAGLINIDTQSDVVRLVHYTTQEYLERTEKDWFPKAETYIAMTCVTYLSFNKFKSGYCRTYKEFKERLTLYSLYDYAAQYWGHHARTASVEVEQSILDFLLSEAKVSASVQALIASRNYAGDFGYSQSVPRQITGIHLAAYFGLTRVIMTLLKNIHHPDVKDGWGWTPLSWAAEQGHEAMVKLLLEKGAQLESKDNRYGQTPLSWAAEQGHEAMVKLLLEKGAEVESKDVSGKTPLSYAAENGHEAVIKLLLSRGDVEVNSWDQNGKTPLSRAVEGEHETIVKLLLTRDDVVANSLTDSDSCRESMGDSSNLMASSKTSLIDTLASKNQVEPDLTHHETDDDVVSLVSDMEDIGSQRSISRIPQAITAEHHLAIALARHSQLTSLHKEALAKIGVGRFIENLRRLLKQYYLDLRQNADTNLKRAGIDILKNRSSRYRIAKQILDVYRPDSEEIQTEMQKPEDTQERRSRLEQWIVNNQGFSTEVHYSERVRSVEQGVKTTMQHWENDFSSVERGVKTSVQHWENDSSSEEIDSESESYTTNPWPNVAEMEKFILGGIAFQNLIANFQVFLLPRDLRTQITPALMCIPKKDRWFSPEEDLSFQNKLKIFAESITEQDWDWWPFRAKMRLLKKNETRLHWHCHCNKHLWTEVPEAYKEGIEQLLNNNINKTKPNHLCALRRHKKPWSRMLESIRYAIRSVSGTNGSFNSGAVVTASNSSHIAAQGQQRQRNTLDTTPKAPVPATSSQQGPQTNFTMPQSNEKVVLFGVKGARRTLELAQIDTLKHNEDEIFFQSLKKEYRRLRGILRYWFSVWQLKHCDFVKFQKIRANRVIYVNNEIPTDIIYDYEPRPPLATNPPINPHEFELALSSCSNRCMWSAFHDCVESESGTHALERIPKRKAAFELNTGGHKEAWGIQAQHVISFVHMLFYHCLIIAGTFGFWIWWQVNNPHDLQSAAVPLTTVAVLLSLFWSSAGVLRILREPQ